MPWNKSGVLRQLRQAYRKGLPRSDIRKLEKLAREYGATREEIARAKKGTTRR
jgi:hypothetical protein